MNSAKQELKRRAAQIEEANGSRFGRAVNAATTATSHKPQRNQTRTPDWKRALPKAADCRFASPFCYKGLKDGLKGGEWREARRTGSGGYQRSCQ